MLKYIVLGLSLLFMTACGSSYKASTQVTEQAFVQLTGNFWNTQISLDNQAPVMVTEDTVESFELHDKDVVRFPVAPGPHLVTISRNGSVIVKRKIYVSNSNVFEVMVP
ncbi:MAG: hypothetical protein HAW66_03610 [Shewanella sp.]|nr:hypothetical protein [Shewanella sp.]